MYKNGTHFLDGKLKMLDFTFDFLTDLSIRPERAGTLVYVSIVPPPPPHFFSFLSYPLFMLTGENGWG